MVRALSVPIESERGSGFLIRRVFFTRTGIHFARKRSNPSLAMKLVLQLGLGALQAITLRSG
jgi:hypothetical protein